MTTAAIEARRVLYSGRVQGVGFRYTAHQIAQRYAVTGYVKNLHDGRVELHVEGTAAEIQRLLDEIAAAMAANIGDADVSATPVTGKFDVFAVSP